MEISRRHFIASGSAAVGAAALLGACDRERESNDRSPAAPGNAAFDPADWQNVRDQFDLDPSLSHLSAFILASHPRSVRDAIARHRAGLDENTKTYIDQNELQLEEAVSDALSGYVGAPASEIALTDSTTMGLGLVYGGLRVNAGDELLATTHDFYSTHEAMRLSAERHGATSVRPSSSPIPRLHPSTRSCRRWRPN